MKTSSSPNLTIIHLTDEHAVQFLAFQKLMASVGGFDIKSGSLTINFDKTGKISSVDKREHFNVPQTVV